MYIKTTEIRKSMPQGGVEDQARNVPANAPNGPLSPSPIRLFKVGKNAATLHGKAKMTDFIDGLGM